MEIKLTPLQNDLISKAVVERESAGNKVNEIIDLIFAYHKVTKPTTAISLTDGKLTWQITPEVIEG